MTDREKVVNAIKRAKQRSADNGLDIIIVPLKEADVILGLLKEQKAALLENQHKPEKVFHMKDRSIINETHGKTGFCPRCNQVVIWEINRCYCGFCGKGLIWDGN